AHIAQAARAAHLDPAALRLAGHRFADAMVAPSRQIPHNVARPTSPPASTAPVAPVQGIRLEPRPPDVSAPMWAPTPHAAAMALLMLMIVAAGAWVAWRRSPRAG